MQQTQSVNNNLKKLSFFQNNKNKQMNLTDTSVHFPATYETTLAYLVSVYSVRRAL